MIKVRIRKPLIEEELLIEDIRNLGLPPIVVTRILEEFTGQDFSTKKAQDVIGRMYKEEFSLTTHRSRLGSELLSDLWYKITKNWLELTGYQYFHVKFDKNEEGELIINKKHHLLLQDPEQTMKDWEKIHAFVFPDIKREEEGFITTAEWQAMKMDFKGFRGLQKSINKFHDKKLRPRLQIRDEDKSAWDEETTTTLVDAIKKVVEQEFATVALGFYEGQFKIKGLPILNYLKKHPMNYKDLANLGFKEALAFVKDILLTQEKEEDIVYKYKDGFYWINLGEGGCELEATRMAHCGKDDRGDMVSLRTRPKGSKMSKSHVTLSYNSHNDTIYQAKGLANTAPDEEYWPYIVDFIERFEVGYMEETGEHSSDDFSAFINYIEGSTDAEVDTTIRELENLIDEINNGNHNNENLTFSAEWDNWGEEPYALFDAYVNMEVEIEIPGRNYDMADKMEHVMFAEKEDILERIREIDYLENYLEDEHHISMEWDTPDDIDGPTHMTVKIAMSPQLETHTASNAEALRSMIEDIEYNFGPSDIETFEENIKNIIMDFMGEVITTPGSEKYREIYKKIEEIENGFKHFYAEYDLYDYKRGIEFVLSKTLRAHLPAFPHQQLKGWKNIELTPHFTAQNSYDKIWEKYMEKYQRSVRQVFPKSTMVKILNDAFGKFASDAAFYAAKQTRLDFPNFDLSDLDDEFKTDAMSPFNEEDLEVRYPSKLQLQQSRSDTRLPTIGFKSNTTINWTDDLEQILFVMEWVQYIDKHWKDIEGVMQPTLENLVVRLKAIRKEEWNGFREELEDMVDSVKQIQPQLPLSLQENKRKIKVLIKK